MPVRENEPRVFSPSEIMERGLELEGFTRYRQQKVNRDKNIQRFQNGYGSEPLVISLIWEDLLKTKNLQARIEGLAKKRLDCYLIAHHFLYKYPTFTTMSGQYNLDEGTVAEWCWYFVDRIQALAAEKIVWPEEWGKDDCPITFLYSVDGKHCRIQEPKHDRWSKNPKAASHKDKHAAYNWELALSLWEPKLVWMKGPKLAGTHDITVFRGGDGSDGPSLKEKTPKGKKGIADLGYRGEKELLSVPNSHDPEELRKFKSRARARQESFNGRITFFNVIGHVFRHKEVEKHEKCFKAVCVIVQYQMENGHPIFDN